jgi:hypothetical protein
MVSPTGVRSVWLRNGLQTFRLRLVALENGARCRAGKPG